MNKKRRERLREATISLGNILNSVEGIRDEENDCLNNYPENLQNSDAYYDMEDAVDYLTDAVYGLQEVIKNIVEAAK